MSTKAHDSRDLQPLIVVPPLVPGDRMTRNEFDRRWAAMPELKHAELIEGVVHMAAAVRYEQHGRPHAMLQLWLGHYAVFTPGVETADNTSMRLDLDNQPQPDAMLRISEHLGGQSTVSTEGYLEGAPELVAEVSASSSSFDLHDKLNVYRKHGVREYIVWRVLDQEVDWFVLCNGRFETTEPHDDGIYRGGFFPGLWLNTQSLLAGDGRQVLETLQQGLATAEHNAFAEELRQRDTSHS